MVTVADTAYSIAIIRRDEASLPEAARLFDDPYAKIFAEAGAHAAQATARFLALPFFAEGVRIRTRFIDDAVRAALAEGIDQVVLMGAGFDARGLRMREIDARGARVFEIDFAEQLEKKRALLASAGVGVPGRVKHVPCDFTAPDFDADLERELGAAGFRVGGGAVFVWEGVLPYIGQAAIDRSLAFMARVGGPGARVAFEFAPVIFDPDTAADRVTRHGFDTFEDTPFEVLFRRWLPGEPPPIAAMLHAGIARRAPAQR